MKNNLFDDIGFEEMNEIMNNLPNDFDIENKTEKRIRNKTIKRIMLSEGKRVNVRKYSKIAAALLLAVAILWAGTTDKVSAFVYKTFLVPGAPLCVTGFNRPDMQEDRLNNTPITSFTHTVDGKSVFVSQRKTPLVLTDSVSVKNTQGIATIYNVFTSDMVRSLRGSMDYNDITQYYEDMDRYYDGITFDIEIKLIGKSRNEFKALLEEYREELKESGYDPDEDGIIADHELSLGAMKKFFDGLSVFVDGKYSESGRNMDFDYSSGTGMNNSQSVITLESYTILFRDDNMIDADKTYTVTVKHSFLGEYEFKFKLEEAEPIENCSELITVTNNGIPVTAAKYKTNIGGKDYIAVVTSVDCSAVDGSLHAADVGSYRDAYGIEHPIAFKKANGSLVAPQKVSNGTFYFDANKVDDGDNFIIPSLHLFFAGYTEFTLPIPDETGDIKKANAVLSNPFGEIIIKSTELVENYSYLDEETKGSGLLIDIEWKDYAGNKTQFNGFLAIRENPTHIDGAVINDCSNYIERTDYEDDAPYFTLVNASDKDSITFSSWNYFISLTTEYEFNF